jgi:hypothetical protein
MGKFDDLLSVLGQSSRPSRTEVLMRARRQFDVVPGDLKAVEDGDLPLQAFMQHASVQPPTRAAYVSNPLSPGAPVKDWDLPRATAIYPRGNRELRRHEVMHGIQHAARLDPEISGALPFWARGAKNNSFADELLARLASQQDGAVLDWPVALYRQSDFGRNSPFAYRAAEPALWIGRQLRDHPVASGAVIGTGAMLGAAGAASQYEESP